MLTFEFVDPECPDALELLNALSIALAAITGDSGRSSFDPSDVRAEGGLFVIARGQDGRALGCGTYRRLHAGVAEIKRMFAVPGSKGVGAAILELLERRARDAGYDKLWLETRLVNERAIRFYTDQAR